MRLSLGAYTCFCGVAIAACSSGSSPTSRDSEGAQVEPSALARADCNDAPESADCEGPQEAIDVPTEAPSVPGDLPAGQQEDAATPDAGTAGRLSPAALRLGPESSRSEGRPSVQRAALASLVASLPEAEANRVISSVDDLYGSGPRVKDSAIFLLRHTPSQRRAEVASLLAERLPPSPQFAAFTRRGLPAEVAIPLLLAESERQSSYASGLTLGNMALAEAYRILGEPFVQARVGRFADILPGLAAEQPSMLRDFLRQHSAALDAWGDQRQALIGSLDFHREARLIAAIIRSGLSQAAAAPWADVIAAQSGVPGADTSQSDRDFLGDLEGLADMASSDALEDLLQVVWQVSMQQRQHLPLAMLRYHASEARPAARVSVSQVRWQVIAQALLRQPNRASAEAALRVANSSYRCHAGPYEDFVAAVLEATPGAMERLRTLLPGVMQRMLLVSWRSSERPGEQLVRWCLSLTDEQAASATRRLAELPAEEWLSQRELVAALLPAAAEAPWPRRREWPAAQPTAVEAPWPRRGGEPAAQATDAQLHADNMTENVMNRDIRGRAEQAVRVLVARFLETDIQLDRIVAEVERRLDQPEEHVPASSRLLRTRGGHRESELARWALRGHIRHSSNPAAQPLSASYPTVLDDNFAGVRIGKILALVWHSIDVYPAHRVGGLDADAQTIAREREMLYESVLGALADCVHEDDGPSRRDLRWRPLVRRCGIGKGQRLVNTLSGWIEGLDLAVFVPDISGRATEELAEFRRDVARAAGGDPSGDLSLHQPSFEQLAAWVARMREVGDSLGEVQRQTFLDIIRASAEVFDEGEAVLAADPI